MRLEDMLSVFAEWPYKENTPIQKKTTDAYFQATQPQ